MTTQREIFPDRKPRQDWLMSDALATLEWFLAEGERRGLKGAELDQYARNKTWEKMEYPNGRPEE